MHYGKIKFFDSKKNNFGFITDVNGDEGKLNEDVFIHRDDVICSVNELNEGTPVIFTLIKGKKNKAVTLNLFSSLPLSKKLNFAFVFETQDFHKFIYDDLRKSTSLSVDNKTLISKKILSEKLQSYPVSSLKILKLLGETSYIVQFFDKLKTLKDNEKISLNDGETSYITHLTQIWNFESEVETVRLLELIKTSKNIEGISSQFTKKILEISSSYKVETIIKFYGIFSNTSYLEKYLYKNFKNLTDNFDQILTQIERHLTNEEAKQIYFSIKEQLIQNKWPISISQSINFFKLIERYNEKDNCEEVLKIIISQVEVEDSKSFIELIRLSDKYSLLEPHLENFISKLKLLKQKFNDSQRLELFDLTKGKLLKLILKTWDGKYSYDNEKLLQKVIIEVKFHTMVKEISEIVVKILSSIDQESYYNSGDYAVYFDYIKFYKDSATLKILLFGILFRKENFLNSNIKYFSDEEIVWLLKNDLDDNTDIDYADKIKIVYFLLKENYLPEIEVFRRVLGNSRAFIQSLIFRRGIFLFSQNKMKRDKYSELYKLEDWTDISSHLIKKFLGSKPKDRTEALKLLAEVFRKHIYKLNEVENFSESFDDLINIKGMVKDCDGRKYYDTELWEKNGISRRYIKDDTISVSSPIGKYCEGRFWKNQKLYISGTNNSKDVNLYWCRGSVCYGLNSTANLELSYDKWSILEIAKVFQIQIDPLIHSTIAGWANRMNEITERLRCSKCNSILRPLPFDPKILGHYATPLFTCLDSDCTELNKKIRFTHCLNGKCEKILDSRELKTCSNGWLICTCGTCCPQHSGKEYEPKYVQDN